MKTELDYCLLTYTCDCAATIASTEDHDEEQSSEREPFEFGRCRIVERQNFDRDCDDPLCKCKDSAESRKKEVHRLIRQIQSRCRENSTAYIKLGQRYHSCLLRARMRLSNSKLCAPAHEQFAISTTPRRDDPFFKLDGKVQSLLFGPRIAIQDVEDVHILKLAMRVVNKALFLSCLKAEMMLSRVGVNAIVAAERKEFGPVTPRGEVKSKGLPQKDSASGKEQKHTLPLPRKLSLPDDEAFSGKSINHPLSSCRSSPQKSSGSAATATHTEAARLNSKIMGSKRAKLPRHPDYTWPVHRWSMYNPRGLVQRNSCPLSSRKLNARAGLQRNSERERLFQKMIYGQWMKGVNGPRSGCVDSPDM